MGLLLINWSVDYWYLSQCDISLKWNCNNILCVRPGKKHAIKRFMICNQILPWIMIDHINKKSIQVMQHVVISAAKYAHVSHCIEATNKFD